MHLEFAGIKFCNVEHIVNKIQEVSAALVNDFAVFPIPLAAQWPKQFVRDHFGKPENCVQRCSQFMAKIRDECAACLESSNRLLTCFFGDLQFGIFRLELQPQLLEC